MQYVNLNTLKIETTNPEDKIMINAAIVPYDDLQSISCQWLNTIAAVKKAFDPIDRPTRPHKFEFEVQADEELSVESFESAVKLILAAAFEMILVDTRKGRPRERRLDVPENLKTLNCNMSLLKNAINYQTLVDKFQIEIYSGDLRYILVGGYGE
jgi:hypothetical protein